MNTSEIKHFFMSQLFQIFPQGVIFTIAFYKNGYSLSHHYYKIKIQSLGTNLIRMSKFYHNGGYEFSEDAAHLARSNCAVCNLFVSS